MDENVSEEDRRRGCPDATEVALHEAKGERLIWIDGKPHWIKKDGVTWTPQGGEPIPLVPARRTGEG